MGRGRRGEARALNGALSQIVAFGIAAGLSPIPIVGVVLMLGTPRAKANSLAFAASWVASIFACGTIITLASSGTGAAGSEGDTGTVVWKVVVGVLLVLLGLRYWRQRPRGGEEAKTPKWMETVDRFDAARSAALAFGLSILNPKNLLLVISAAGAVSSAGLSSGDEILAIAIFTAIATIGVAAPIAIFFAMGARSADLLARLKGWMTANNAPIMAVICALLGAYLIVKGLGS